MPHLYEYMTDADLYAYIRGVIDRAHGSLADTSRFLTQAEDDAATATDAESSDRPTRVTATRRKT
jgi:hypothetical protein